MTVTAKDLEVALSSALSGSTFDMGRVVTERPEGSFSSYDNRPSETLDPQGLRQMYESAGCGDEELRRVRSVVVRMHKTSRTELIDTLRNMLHDYVDSSTGSVGHAFPMGGDRGSGVRFERDGLRTNSQFSSVEKLADSLTRGSAVAGCDRVAELVAGWAAGAPMTYQTRTVVPITIARPVSPIPGVDIVPLGLSTGDLPAGLPGRGGKSRGDYLGQSLISVDTETTPALFRPATPSPLEQPVRTALTPGVTLETIREALSLECDTFVDDGPIWDDYGEFFALADRDVGIRGTVGHLRRIKGRTIIPEIGVTTLELFDDGIQDLSELDFGRLLRRLMDADARTRVAVSRWKTAMNEIRGLPNRFIDLRIALESLFLPQQPDQELKFRVAVSGAWFIGEGPGDRRRVWNTLRSAYDLASTAVHGGDVKKKEGSAGVLTDALALCRKGILSVLNKGPITDWTDLIWGCPDA